MVLLIPLLYALWSLAFPIGKQLLLYGDPLFIVAVRTLMGSFILSLILLFQRKNLKISLKEGTSIAIYAFFSIFICNVLEYMGMQHLSSAKVCFLYSLSPFFTALFAYIHFKEKMTPKKWIGMFIGFVGFLPVLASQEGAEDLLRINAFLSWPALAVILAAISSVYGWILLKMLVKTEALSPIKVNCYGMAFGGFLALFSSYLFESWNNLPLTGSVLAPFFGWNLAIVFISNIICFNLYGYMLKRFSATLLSFFGLLSPIFASFNAYFLLGEPLNPTLFLSTFVVSIGLFIIYQAELAQKQTDELERAKD